VNLRTVGVCYSHYRADVLVVRDQIHECALYIFHWNETAERIYRSLPHGGFLGGTVFQHVTNHRRVNEGRAKGRYANVLPRQMVKATRKSNEAMFGCGVNWPERHLVVCCVGLVVLSSPFKRNTSQGITNFVGFVLRTVAL